MTREEANKELERAFDVLDHTCHMDNRRKEAFNMARVALSAEPCDCISRKEVMKALCNNCELCKDGVQTCFSKCEEYHFLVTLPSIQPTTKENLVVEDCISRKALIEYANNLKDGIGITANDIVRLPSIQPKPKTDVLDKIRTEIEFIPTIEWKDDGTTYILASYFKKQVLEIIDKYKAEKE